MDASPHPGRRSDWLDRRVIAYAHQGGAWEAPSSTLYAIRSALDAGATGIELDVHATADGHLVVSHDPTVDRTTNGSGNFVDLTLAEVRALDNAYWWAPGADVSPGLDPDSYPFRGRAPGDHDFRVATLDEVLEAFPGVVLNLDIKQTAPEVAPYEEALAAVLKSHGRQDDVIVASFLDRATDAFSSFAPDIPTSAGTAAVALFYQAVRSGEDPPPMRHVALQVPATHAGVTLVDASFIDAAHRAGMAVHVWTIDEETEMQRLCALGVDGIITDLPTTLVDVLDARSASWRPGTDAS
ncbi:MAG TPA: glycerophosphodiester phosphodiesterase [Acidimicrobiales bacterium]|nr:glycerophosphodiester phosphodiesterase [Acidimicrobiales bacterium]